MSQFIAFDPASKKKNLPPERRYVLLMLAENTERRLLPSCAVGYLLFGSTGAWFVIPGIGGTVTHFCDCLGDDFRTPIITDKFGMRSQMTNGKRGVE